MQSIDGGGVVLQLVRDILVLLEQGLNVRFVLADVVGRNKPQDVQHPGVDIVGVGQELVEVDGFGQTLLPIEKKEKIITENVNPVTGAVVVV